MFLRSLYASKAALVSEISSKGEALNNKEGGKMTEATVSFSLGIPLERSWDFFGNIERWSSCVPGFKEVKKISENEYEGIIEARVLRTSREIKGRIEVEEVKPLSYIKYRGQGELKEGFFRYKITLGGTLNLERLCDDETRVTFNGSVHSSGLGGAIINKIVSGQMTEMMQKFEQNVKAALALA